MIWPLLYAGILQAQLIHITVHGTVLDENGYVVPNVYVINKRGHDGSFGRPDGTFSVQCYKSDTLLVGSLGFVPRAIAFADSVPRSEYYFKLYLEHKVQRLPEVEIFAPRDLDAIRQEINKLGYDKHDFALSGIDAAQSPITFLYQQWSRKERSRRAVAEMENNDRRRELLKELFRLYVDYDIINLSNDEFDAFIDFINVDDQFLKSSSQYDFLLFVKDRYNDYKVWKRRQKLDANQFDYDKD